MIIFKILFWLLISIVGIWFSFDAFVVAFGKSKEAVTVDGFLNVWASIFCAFLGVFVAYYFVMELMKSPITGKRFNVIGLSFATIVAPLLAFGIHSQSLSTVENYVECNDLRQISSRYSSRTYAISDAVCLRLVNDKNK